MEGTRQHWVHALAMLAALWLSGCATLRTTALPAGQPVRGASTMYEITPAPGWRVAPRGGTDLKLVDADGRERLIVWYYGGAGHELDKILAWRRDTNRKRGAQEYHESRFFLPNSDLIVASLARYGFRSSVASESAILVLTVATERGALEIIGHCGVDQEQELTAVVTSLRVIE